MSRAIAACALLAVLAACHQPAVPVRHAGPTPRAAGASLPTGGPPRSGGSGPTSPTPAISEGPTTAITGVVRLDPAYLLAAGAGKLIGERGTGYVAANAGTLIGDAGGGLLSDQGAGLLSDQGGGILANNAGNLIANNAGNLIAPNGGTYHLAATADLLPVAGMAIVPVDLANGRVVGRAFYTDPTGAFTARVPVGLAGNLALAAVVPAKDPNDPVLSDPRLGFGLIVPAGGNAPAVIDEDTAVAAAYLRACFAGRLELALGSDDFDATLAALAGVRTIAPALKATMLDLAKQFRARAVAAGVDKLPAAARKQLARRVAGSLLSHVDLEAVKLDAALSPGWKGPQEPAIEALVTVMAGLRARAATLLAADPNAFAAKPYLAGTQIRRPSDLGDFVVKAYLLGNDPNGIIKAGDVMVDVGADKDASGLDQEERLRAAYYATITALAQTFLLDEQARADAYGLIDRAKP
jgi:hypothetical protein